MNCQFEVKLLLVKSVDFVHVCLNLPVKKFHVGLEAFAVDYVHVEVVFAETRDTAITINFLPKQIAPNSKVD